MDHFAGLDVSVKDTSICIVDDTGKIVREVKVASEPAVLVAVLTQRQTRLPAGVTRSYDLTTLNSACHASIPIQRIADLTRVMQLDPNFPRVTTKLAEAYYRRGGSRQKADPSGAIADYNQALQFEPKFNIYRDRAGARKAKGDIDFVGARTTTIVPTLTRL
jgi:hypothetical protein